MMEDWHRVEQRNWIPSGADILVAESETGFTARYRGSDRPIGAARTLEEAKNWLVRHVMAVVM